MSRDQMKTIVVVVLVVVGVPGALFYAFSGTGGTAAPQPDDSSTSATNVQSVFEKIDLDIDELVKSIKEVGFDYTRRKSARDPMAPLAGGSRISRGTGEALAGLVCDLPELGPLLFSRFGFRGHGFFLPLMLPRSNGENSTPNSLAGPGWRRQPPGRLPT